MKQSNFYYKILIALFLFQIKNSSTLAITHYDQTDIFYKISKNNIEYGYLLGSVHSNFTLIDYEAKQKILTPFLQECQIFFLETILPHYSLLSLGIERALLQSIEQKTLNISIQSFESPDFQMAMLHNRIWLGEKIVTLPWHRYTYIKKQPQLFLFLNQVAASWALGYNIFYNIKNQRAHTTAILKWQEEQSIILQQLLSKYFAGKVEKMIPDDISAYFMQERNIDYTEQLLLHLNPEKKIFCTVGASHLPGAYGLIRLLTKSGYTLSSIDIKQ